jgi:hypothetical protein
MESGLRATADAPTSRIAAGNAALPMCSFADVSDDLRIPVHVLLVDGSTPGAS